MAEAEIVLGAHNLALGGVRDHSPDYSEIEPLEQEPNDIELALQTFVVRLPDEPMTINGEPFGFEVNGERLVSALNYARVVSLSPGWGEPRLLTVSLGESLPPRVTDTDNEPEPPIYNYKDRGLHIDVPKELVKSSVTTDELAMQVQILINRDLENGMNQSSAMKFHRGASRAGRIALAAGLVGVGEAVGIVSGDDKLVNVLVDGGIGAVVGGAAAIAILTARFGVYRYLRGGILEPFARKAQRTALKENGRIPSNYFEEPIITVVPAREENDDR